MTNPMYKFITMIMICSLPLISFSQEAKDGVQDKAQATVESTIKAFYKAVTFDESTTLDFSGFNEFFTSNALLTPLHLIDQGACRNTMLHPLVFLAEVGPLLVESQMKETIISMQINEYGRIAQALVTSESEFQFEGNTMKERAVTSFQLVNVGFGWRITSMVREIESENNPIPVQFLK